MNDNETRVCSKCKKTTPIFQMSKDAGRRDGISSWCKLCRAASGRKWHSKNTGRTRKRRDIPYEKNRNFVLKSRYGITSSEYEHLRETQGYLCGICKRDSREMTYHLHVDHNHTTGELRGLLCAPCNAFLGYIKDDITKLESAIDYLERKAHGNK